MMRPYWDDRTKGRIRRWWAAQVSDAEIARRLGVGQRQVCTWRQKLGLPSWYAGGRLNAHQRALRRAAMVATQRSRGVRSLQQLAPGWADRRKAELATRYGLPADLNLTQTRVLIRLVCGPATASQLATALGLRAGGYKAFNSGDVCESGNYLTNLVRRGLITRIPVERGPGCGSGRGESTYLLAPLAMNMLAARKDGAA